MGDHDWAMYLGYAGALLFGIYLVTKVIGVQTRTIEGLTSSANAVPVSEKLKAITKVNTVEKDNLHLQKYLAKYQDILSTVEENAAISQLNIVMNASDGIPSGSEMDTYLQMDKFRTSLKDLDDYLDTMGGMSSEVSGIFGKMSGSSSKKKKETSKKSWF